MQHVNTHTRTLAFSAFQAPSSLPTVTVATGPTLQFPWWPAALLSSHRTAGLPWSLQPKRGMWRWWKNFWITAHILSTETWWATPININTNMECYKHFIQYSVSFSQTFHIRYRQRISCYASVDSAIMKPVFAHRHEKVNGEHELLPIHAQQYDPW